MLPARAMLVHVCEDVHRTPHVSASNILDFNNHSYQSLGLSITLNKLQIVGQKSMKEEAKLEGTGV